MHNLLALWDVDLPDDMYHVEFEFVPHDGRELLVISVDVDGDFYFISSEVGRA